MAKKTVSKYEFAGLPIYDIIGKPLIAIARAQSMMAKEQLRSLLESCFRHRDGVYEPILLKMTVTRSFVEPIQNAMGIQEITQVTTFFYLPMVTIFPMNSLGIETAEIDFNVEITSQYSQESEYQDSVLFDPTSSRKAGMGIMGKISNKPASEDETEKGTDNSSSLHITVEAGTLPLTKGLLELINIYTSSIQTSDANTNI